MNPRVFFGRQTLVAFVLALGLLFSLQKFEFIKPIPLSDPGYELTPSFFKFISTGFWPAAADTLWIETLQLIGTANYSPETLPTARSFYRLATDLDPNFYELYEQGGILFLFYYENPEAAIEILSQGVSVFETGNPPRKFWTHPATLYIYLAYVYAFQKNDWESAKRIYIKASTVEHAPPYLVGMRQWLEKEGSEKKLAVKTLRMLIAHTEDPVIKEKYQEKLKHYE